MIGMIVSGHGHFASGLSSSVKLIIGTPEKYEAIDFIEEFSIDDLKREMNAAIDRLSDCKGILIFTDLTGGSPFKTAVEISMERSDKNLRVLGGTNLGMLIETSMARAAFDNLDVLADMSTETGKEQIVKYAYVERVEVESEDGI